MLRSRGGQGTRVATSVWDSCSGVLDRSAARRRRTFWLRGSASVAVALSDRRREAESVGLTIAHSLIHLRKARIGGDPSDMRRSMLSRSGSGSGPGGGLSYERFLSMRRFPALDGLRGVAALLVVAYHFGGREFAWLSGWTGIQVFFVLSGFLLTTLALREESSFGSVSLRNFWVRRLFRITPAYFVVLLAMILTTSRRGGSDWIRMQEALPHYWTFTNEFGHPDSPWMLSWTLGIEQKFYLLWPLVAFALILSARVRLVTIGLLAGPLTIAAVTWGDASGRPAAYVSILVGCALAVVMHTRAGFAFVARLTTPIGRTTVLLLFIVAQLLVEKSHARVGEVATVAFVFVIAALLPGLLTEGAAAIALSTRPMIWLGARSYSLYLCQVLAAWTVYALLPDLGSTTMVIATMIVGVMVADFVYRYVESPMIRTGRRLERARVAHDAPSPPEEGVRTRQVGATLTIPAGQPGTDHEQPAGRS
jgi:peptidoglycan/LPS O-acetylase OafA/YrhL